MWWAPGATEGHPFDNGTGGLTALNQMGADGWELVHIEETLIAAPGGNIGSVPIDRTEWTTRSYLMKRRVR
jgi:hypothetical protein